MSTRLLILPPGWTSQPGKSEGVLLRARGPSPGASGRCPSVCLRRDDVTESAARWAQSVVADLARRRTDFDLDDEDVYLIGATDATYRRYGFRLDDDDLLCEEWSWLVDGVGYTLRCTSAREDYESFCDLFEQVAETFEPPLRLTA